MAIFSIPLKHPHTPPLRAPFSDGFQQLSVQKEVNLPSLPFLSLPFPALLFAHKNCICPFSQGFPLLCCLSAMTPTPLSASRLSRIQTPSYWYLHADAHGSREPSFPSNAEPSPPSGCTLLLLLYSSKQSLWYLHTSSPAALILSPDPSLKMSSPEKHSLWVIITH